MKIIKVKNCLNCPRLRSTFNNYELRCIHSVWALKNVTIDKKKFKIPENCPLQDITECNNCLIKKKRDKIWRIIEVIAFIISGMGFFILTQLT